LTTAGTELKDLIISGARGVTTGIKGLTKSSRPYSMQGPAANNNNYFPNTARVNDGSKPNSGSMQLLTNAPAAFYKQSVNATDYNNSTPQLTKRDEQKKMVNEKVYPISDYYTSLVTFPQEKSPPVKTVSNFSPAKSSNNFSPSPTHTSIVSQCNFSPAPLNHDNEVNKKLLMTPGIINKNINDAWISNSSPASDYQPMPSDLGPFQKFD
jgi:hypothetical protein